jgi:hypothetical protein
VLQGRGAQRGEQAGDLNDVRAENPALTAK